MDQQQIVQQAMTEALEAKQDFAREQQRQRVSRLGHEIEDRLSALILRAEEARRRVSLIGGEGSVGYSHGAFGHDTETIDRLLAGLADEADRLSEMEAATRESNRLRDKYREVAAQHFEVPAEMPVAVEVGSGQYL